MIHLTAVSTVRVIPLMNLYLLGILFGFAGRNLSDFYLQPKKREKTDS